ncbi:MAG: hydantoinase/oxoprolinase family protein [Candidatus Poribacteria bacterium]|nr:hydantoinase/oxoprolinase family protein [Candidatus Poribacteria bacterium]
MQEPTEIKKIGVDTGGTFTDIVMSMNSSLFTHKVLSTPHNPALAVIKGVSEILEMHDINSFDDVDIVHGSTVATNALLERRGARIAVITTKGFEDVLEIGRQARHNLYDIFVERPDPLIPAERRFGIKERTLHTGEIHTEISDTDLQLLTKHLKSLDLDAIAICLLFSYVNPKNEKIIAEHLSSLNIPISCSHEILPEYREYARFSTTVANAYIRPTLEKHLSTLTESESFPKSFRLMLSNGGCISTSNFEAAGIRTVLSGPAGGVIGAYHVAKTAGYEKIITFDMGGTSTDVSLCEDGITMTTESTISGLPIKVPLIDIHTVGAGGGSIATVDTGGALRVGPESAGADPGPICYGNDGEEITVTDANLFLGRILPTQFLGGKMSLAADKTRHYFEEFSEKIGLSAIDTADGILKIANATMERAIKVISVERGFDTRDFTLVSFGGAGGLHAAFLAENLGIRTVLIPPHGGLLSAFGMLYADIVKDYSQTVLLKTDSGTNLQRQLENGFDTLINRAEVDMKSEGYSFSQVKIERSLDMRYDGQSYELNIPYSDGETDFVNKFHALHTRRFSYSRPEATVEVVNLRINAFVVTDKPELIPEQVSDIDPTDALMSQIPVFFEGHYISTNYYRRESLVPGNRIDGPAIITEFSATTVVPPNFFAHVDVYGNLILKQLS